MKKNISDQHCDIWSIWY